jgi:DUF1680 family protein
VDVNAKQEFDLEVRIPNWTSPEKVQCIVDGRPQAIQFAGRYAQIGRLKKGQTASLSFPIRERIQTISVPDERNHMGSN